jgi:hypothetical protein
MTIFLNVKNLTFYQTILYEFTEVKNNLFTIGCGIEFFIDFINTYFVY